MVAFFLGIYYTIHICAYTDSVKGIFTMKNIKKIIAAVLLLCIAVTACACRYTSNTITVSEPAATLPSDQIVIPTQPTDWATQPSQPQPSDPTDGTVPVTEPVTYAPPDPNATLPYQEPTQPGQPATEAPQTETDPASWSKERIVSYLSDAVNRSKAYTGTVEVDRTENFEITVESIRPNLTVFINLANSLIPKLIKPVDEHITFNGGRGTTTEGEDIPILLPKRQAFVLPPAGVKTATARKSGDNIEISITLVEETGSLTQHPTYTAGSMGYVNLDNFDLGPVKVDTMDIVYPGSTMKAVINSNGYVVTADYKVPVKMDASGSALGLKGAFTGSGYQTEGWVIHW